MRWVDSAHLSLATDFYELTMAAAYVDLGMTGPATFDLFVRSLPPERSFLVAAGLDEALASLEGMRFAPDSLAYLDDLGIFAPGFIEYLEGFRFTGTVRAIPEGEVAFPDEPLLEVTAPRPEAQLVETFLLSQVGFQTMIASKAARVALAARHRSFVDFSPRRDHGVGAALRAARASYIGGANASSLTLAGAWYGIPVTGTMAHSFVMSFPTELEAFRAFARRFPANAVFLIDTYDTEEGARNAVRVADELAPEGIRINAVRLDSGDLVELARRVRRILDEAGHRAIRIFASGDLDEYRIAEMVAAGVPVDAFGVGTRLGTSSDAPFLHVVYKLVEDAGGPKRKLSPAKATLPGRKQVYRSENHDVLALADEPSPGGRALLETVMVDGARTGPPQALADARERCARAVAALPARLRHLQPGEPPYEVRLSAGLRALVEA